MRTLFFCVVLFCHFYERKFEIYIFYFRWGNNRVATKTKKNREVDAFSWLFFSSCSFFVFLFVLSLSLFTDQTKPDVNSSTPVVNQKPKRTHKWRIAILLRWSFVFYSGNMFLYLLNKSGYKKSNLLSLFSD